MGLKFESIQRPILVITQTNTPGGVLLKTILNDCSVTAVGAMTPAVGGSLDDFMYQIWVFLKIGGKPPKSSILIGFSINYKPSILGYHYFWKHLYDVHCTCRSCKKLPPVWHFVYSSQQPG